MPLLPPALLEKLTALTLAARRRGPGVRAGTRTSDRRGRSLEFADHRPYVPGDDLRQLDWHLYGRLDALWIKLFEEEEDRVVQCLLDSSESMAGEKLDYARQVAAALSWIALGHGDRVAVAGLSDGLGSWAAARRGRGVAPLVFQALEAVHPGGKTDLDAALAQLPRQHGSGIALLFTDFLYPDGPDRALERLLSRGNEVQAFHVSSPVDLRPALSGDVLLVDAETGEELAVTVDEEVLDRYEATVRAWADDMERTCRRLGVGYTRLSTAVPIEQVVLDDLRRLGIVSR